MSKIQHNESRADFLRIYGPAVLLAVVAFLVAYQFVAPAPPSRIVMAVAEPGGAYYAFGEKYREILARDKVEVEVRATAGSAENITLLELDESEVQVAFVQGGTHSFAQTDTLVSLATLYYEPLWIFYRSAAPLGRLSDLLVSRCISRVAQCETTASGRRDFANEPEACRGLHAPPPLSPRTNLAARRSRFCR